MQFIFSLHDLLIFGSIFTVRYVHFIVIQLKQIDRNKNFGKLIDFGKLEAVVRRCSVKMVLLEISQNSQENTCARVSFLIKLHNFINKRYYICTVYRELIVPTFPYF